jgi:hypothetical protein
MPKKFLGYLDFGLYLDFELCHLTLITLPLGAYLEIVPPLFSSYSPDEIPANRFSDTVGIGRTLSVDKR